jgi:hypothetical protein
VLGLLFAAALWLAPGEARAFPDEPSTLDEGKKGHVKRFHILGELGMFAGKLEGEQRSIVMSPIVEMRFQLAYSVITTATPTETSQPTMRFASAIRSWLFIIRAGRGSSPTAQA